MNRSSTRLPTYVDALTLLTIDLTTVLRSEWATSPLDHLHLAGAGVLAHRVRPDGTLSFSLDACAAPACAGEGVIIDWLEDELSLGGLIASYDLYSSVLPLIRSLTVSGRHLDLAALAVADTRRFHDLTERVASGAAVTFGQTCGRAYVAVVPADVTREQN